MVPAEHPPAHDIDALALGCASYDVLGTVDEFPPPDGKARIHDLKREGGGPAATAMVACARLGMRTALIAKVGEDDEGRLIRAELEREGVDTSGLIVGSGQRSLLGFCFAHRKSGQRIVYYYRSELPVLDPAQINARSVKRSPLLLIDSQELRAGARAAEIARGAGAVTVMDGGGVRSGVAEALPHIDYLVASAGFALKHTGCDRIEPALEALRWTGYHRAVVITLGEDGWIAAEGGRAPLRGEAFRVKTVDTTGAGDVFHGAFCFGLAQQWPLEQICAFSAACAALKCRALGGRAGAPRLAEALAFCRENARRFTWPEPDRP